MSGSPLLDDLSADALRAEIEARAKGQVATPTSKDLKGVDDQAILDALSAKQKVIYGVDDRVDVFQLTDPREISDADCVVALFEAADVSDNGDGTSTLATSNFGTAYNLCQTEPFRDQPIRAFCSGSLVAPDVIATAGHCVNPTSVTNVRFVFGFRMQNAAAAQVRIANTEIYRGVRLLGRQEVDPGPDWALVRLDRPVLNHRIARLRRVGAIPDNQAVHVVGHPNGLPAKFAGGASVRDNAPVAFFIANLDTYGGNSGSPVFNSATHEVEGVLVRGENDFVLQGGCQVSLVCPTTGCRGEDCTRTTEFAEMVSASDLWVMKFTAGQGWAHLSQIPLHPMEADVNVSAMGFAKIVVAADVDGDGRQELVIAPDASQSAGNDLWVMKFTPGQGWAHLSQDLAHPMETDVDVSGLGYAAKIVVAADVDGEGRQELVIVPSLSPS